MEERKTERIGFRITPTQKRNIDKVGSSLGLTNSELIRDFTIRILDQIGGDKNE